MDKNFFESIQTIAIVGLSEKPDRPSYQVAQYLRSHGYKIIPINPTYVQWEGETAYPDLPSVPKELRIDVVDIFRKSEAVMEVVQQAVKRADAKTIWMQEGVINREAKEYAEGNGLQVFMDLCIMKIHASLHAS